MTKTSRRMPSSFCFIFSGCEKSIPFDSCTFDCIFMDNFREASHIDFVHDKRHMDVMGWGGGEWVGACDVSRWKIVENFDNLMKIFNILKSSIQSIQKSSIFINVFTFSVYMYAHYQVIALPQVYFALLYTTLNLKNCKINMDVLLQKNVDMTFLVEKIDLLRFPFG